MKYSLLAQSSQRKGGNYGNISILRSSAPNMPTERQFKRLRTTSWRSRRNIGKRQPITSLISILGTLIILIFPGNDPLESPIRSFPRLIRLRFARRFNEAFGLRGVIGFCWLTCHESAFTIAEAGRKAMSETHADRNILSTDKHCELLSANIRDCNARITDGFKLFVQMFTGIVGASIWLRLQHQGVLEQSTFAWLADGAAFVVVATCIVIIIDNLRSWYQYRGRLTDVSGGVTIVPLPDLRKSAKIEAAMLTVMVAAFILFCIFNPLSIK
jgi:hypothetical protein